MKTVSQTQIAKFLGIPKSTWGMYVTGKRPMTHNLAKTIEVNTGIDHEFTLGAPIDEIIGLLRLIVGVKINVVSEIIGKFNAYKK